MAERRRERRAHANKDQRHNTPPTSPLSANDSSCSARQSVVEDQAAKLLFSGLYHAAGGVFCGVGAPAHDGAVLATALLQSFGKKFQARRRVVGAGVSSWDDGGQDACVPASDVCLRGCSVGRRVTTRMRQPLALEYGS